MNGKYKPIIEQHEKAKTAKEQRDCMFTMLSMIITNDIPHLWRAIIILGTANLVVSLFPGQITVPKLIDLLMRLF